MLYVMKKTNDGTLHMSAHLGGSMWVVTPHAQEMIFNGHFRVERVPDTFKMQCC